jgi:hypothetical protein
LLIACTYIGERTPIVERMSDPPASIPAEWQMCNISKNFLATVAGYSSTVDDGLRYKKVAENRHGKTSEGLWSVSLYFVTRSRFLNTTYHSLLAELTDIGKQVREYYRHSLSNLTYAYSNSQHIPLEPHCEVYT